MIDNCIALREHNAMLQDTTLRHDTWDELPLLLTVEQASAVLQIGRSKAYELTVEWECTKGVSGLPCVRFGSQKRIPRHALRMYIDALLGGPEVA